MSPILHPIKYLFSRVAGVPKPVPVFVVPMTQELVEKWHDYVQPLIDANYEHWSSNVLPASVRADKLWNWHYNFSLLALHNTFCTYGSPKHGEGLAMCIVYRSIDETEEFPIGMLTAVPKLDTRAFGQRRLRAFTWYLSDAPDQVFNQILGIPPIQGIAKALLDCTIQAALDEQEDGNLLLKADPHGGAKLESFYTRCGMRQLPNNAPAVTRFFRRSATHKYFNFLAPESHAFCANFNAQR